MKTNINNAQDNQRSKSLDGTFSHKGDNLSILSDSVYLFMDLSGKVFEVNQGIQPLLGYAAAEIVGHLFFDHWVVPNMGKFLIKQTLCDNMIRKFVTDIKHQDGSVVVVSINAQFVMDDHRRTAGIECMIFNVTDLHQKEQQFDQTLRDVTGGIAHLINNQMVSVVGTADLVKMQLADRPDLADKLDRISQSGLKAGDVAHHLVAYAQTGELEPMQAIDLNGVISTVFRDYKTKQFHTDPRTLSLQIEPNLLPIMGNICELQTMLKYLLDNAIDATEQQANINISSSHVMRLKKDTGVKAMHVMLSIQDFGQGMNPESQRRIFEPFYSTRFQGRGMSMAHALKIIEHYGGSIDIKTKLGEGSTFKLYFPAITTK